MFEPMRRTAALVLGVAFCCTLFGCTAAAGSDSTHPGSVQSTLPAEPSPAPQPVEKEEIQVLKLTVGDTVFTATLADNSSVDALKELLQEGSLTLEMHDYAGMEKGADLGVELHPGDVVNIPVGVKHWHGAAPDSWFSHLAVEVPGEEGSNEWLEPVDDAVYGQLK